MNSLSRFDLDMIDEDATLYQIEYALSVCGLPLSLADDSYELIGSGAWHDAYKVTVPHQAHPFIVRIRKPIAYGQVQRYEDHANEWHAEYVSTSLYYMQANRARPGICPSIFMYHVSPELTCTIETDMGQRLDLERLDLPKARRFGGEIGSMMSIMHQKKSHIPGTGKLTWDGANLHGVSPNHQPILTRKIEQSYNENILLALTESDLSFDRHLAAEKLRVAYRLRSVDEPIVLINRDVTPENLTVQADNHIGIIDPYPYLGNGTRFAAWFIHVYRFLLPAYSQAERYQASQYDKHAHTLAAVANGFEYGYTQGNTKLAQHITAERWLWTLEQAYDDWQRLQLGDKRNTKDVIKHGGNSVIRKRLHRALRALDQLEF